MLLMKPICAAILLATAGCEAPGALTDRDVFQPTLSSATTMGLFLEQLPPPHQPLDIAVYAFDDQTGQQRATETGSSFSKAVGQGSLAVLIDVLSETSQDGWFNVIERAGIQHLLNERSLIEQSNAQYRGTTKPTLPALRFAGVILEGGVINYESNTLTGGIGASVLGVGYFTQYRRDYVTVALRAVSVSSGEVMTSITTEKAIYSRIARGDVFKFGSVDTILDVEGGFTRNEPVGRAVRQAMELAVLGLIVEGVDEGLWSFENKTSGASIVAAYDARFGQPRLNVRQ